MFLALQALQDMALDFKTSISNAQVGPQVGLYVSLEKLSLGEFKCELQRSKSKSADCAGWKYVQWDNMTVDDPSQAAVICIVQQGC